MEILTRKHYADIVDSWLGKGNIIALVGLRRVGKSFVLKDFVMNHILSKSLITIFGLLYCLFLFSCTEQIVSNPIAGDISSRKTKSSIAEDYYWYHGNQISLTVNDKYVNILLDTTVVKGDELSAFCSELQIESKTKLNKDGLFKAVLKQSTDYLQAVDMLRSDSRILKVFPYFERGNGAEPIGTSQYFYVQIKPISSAGLDAIDTDSFLMQEYDYGTLEDVAERLGVQIVKMIPYMPDWYILSIEGSEFKTAVEAANSFYETGQFVETDPAFMFNFRTGTVNDPYYSYQWGLKNTAYTGYDINVEGAWAITTGSGVKIAIVDQCPDPNHSDLSFNYSSLSYDAQSMSAPSVYNSSLDHGTHVAGIAAAKGNNNTDIVGVAYDSQIIRVSHDLQTVTSTTSAELASGISWAWQSGADVINNSWGDQGGYYYSYLHSSTLESAIVNAMTYGRFGKGSVVVFIAGNYGSNGAVMDYPGTFDDRILTVGAIGVDGYRWYYSGYGTQLDVVAPGDYIISTIPGNNVDYASGTSMAAPHLSGIAALMLSANPNMKREEVVRFIELTTSKINPDNNTYTYYSYSNRNNGKWNNQMGYGLANAAKAVSVSYASSCTPPSGSPSMDFDVTSAVGAVYSDSIVMGSCPSTTVSFYLLASQTNSSYTYYWHFTTSGDPYWSPSFSYVGDEPFVDMNIPKPTSNSVLNLRCEIYDGTTHLWSAYFNLGVNPEF